MLFNYYRPNPIFEINSLILVLVVPNRSADSGISMYPSFSYIYKFKPYRPIEISNDNWWQHNLASYDKYVEIFKAVISNRNIMNISYSRSPRTRTV